MLRDVLVFRPLGIQMIFKGVNEEFKHCALTCRLKWQTLLCFWPKTSLAVSIFLFNFHVALNIINI